MRVVLFPPWWLCLETYEGCPGSSWKKVRGDLTLLASLFHVEHYLGLEAYVLVLALCGKQVRSSTVVFVDELQGFFGV